MAATTAATAAVAGKTAANSSKSGVNVSITNQTPISKSGKEHQKTLQQENLNFLTKSQASSQAHVQNLQQSAQSNAYWMQQNHYNAMKDYTLQTGFAAPSINHSTPTRPITQQVGSRSYTSSPNVNPMASTFNGSAGQLASGMGNILG